MKKTEDKFSVGHHMGKSCGYDVLPDGSIKLAPMLSDRMCEVIDRENGLRDLLDATNRFVANELARTAKERRGWWNRVEEELSIVIAPGSGWTFHAGLGTIIPAPPQADDSTEAAQ